MQNHTPPTIHAHNEARIVELELTVRCGICFHICKFSYKQLSVSHVSNDGKRGGVYFAFQCLHCQTWHEEVPLYKSVSDGLKG